MYFTDDQPTFSENIPFELVTAQIKGCECEMGLCKTGDCLCTTHSQCFYENRKLNRAPESIDVPVYECNSDCSCSDDCPNRLVQLNNDIVDKCYVKETFDGRGRGLFAIRDIDRYEWICNYSGEYITSEEADVREALYEGNGTGHNFVMQFVVAVGERSDAVCIDGGPLAHDEGTDGQNGQNGQPLPPSAFVNHSCQPNTHLVPVYVDNPHLPLLALFTTRRVPAHAQLSFSYCQGGQARSTVLSTTACLCGADTCLGFLPRCERC